MLNRLVLGFARHERKLLCSLRHAHTSPRRDPRFGKLGDSDLEAFCSILDDVGVITDQDALTSYNTDWIKQYTGSSQVVLKPKTREQVAQLLHHCHERRLAVVPQGGNTGLVGGSVPVFDEVIISTSAMNQIISFDPVSGALVCQAGCVLQALDEHVSAQGFIMPLDLGAKGSCQIGGNVSTNAGGLRLLRYGSLRGSVLGVEAVLPDGTLVDLLRTLRKDNTGLDLKQLFIGAEGSLGMVTAVAIQCAPKPASVQLAFLACESYVAVQQILSKARAMLGEVLSAVEFLDAECMQMATKYLEGVEDPLDPGGDASPFYMLIETHGSNAKHDTEKLDGFLEDVMTNGLVSNGTVSQSSVQTAQIWRVREGVTEALARRGALYKYDLSMPVAEMYDLVETLRQRLAGLPGVHVLGYGHVGDGNLHLNVSVDRHDDRVKELLEPFVYEWTTERRGSVSAEHGLGLMKAEVIGYSKPPEAVAIMAGIKAMLDPRGIMNPYKVLPAKAMEMAYGGWAGQSTGDEEQPAGGARS